MRFRLSRRALDDMVRAFVEGSDRFGIKQAERYQRELTLLFELIATQPGMGRGIEDAHGRDIRLPPHRRHVIIYTVTGEAVVILRVRHGREDWVADPLG